jgi:uroporphyrin-III C-methyltransferase / precorrin-2 dehydrogenase / sirohydrochlorin ferrochelatase
MQALPIFINITDRLCVVVGGGDVAVRKVGALLKANATVTLISPEICHELKVLVDAQKIHYSATRYRAADQLQGACLVIAATDDHDVNTAVSNDAKALNIPVNVVDSPSLCTFTMASIVERSPIVIAISSEGNAPVLARYIRTKIETMLPEGYGRIAHIAGEFRDKVKAKFPTTQQRRIFWEGILQGPIVERILSGQEAAARTALEDALSATPSQQHGEVYLVGGGPGDPDLLTFRALRLMQQCDVCVYDKLVSPEVMELVRRDAELIYVGKARDQHTLPQEEINELLAKLALEGKRVLRLKGGDPFIFGRGGEEIETLMARGVPFQVVPGITAANGVSSYAGIPLTHRDYAQACLFITGHLKNGTLDLDWVAMSRPRQTVVVYMGLVGLAEICQQLIKHGVAPSMPVAVVEQGTTQRQRVVTATLQDLAEKVASAQLKAPCLTIIGEVVRLREQLNWFEPATGK